MPIMREWLDRLLGTLGLRRNDRDLEEELRAHLALAEEDAARRQLATASARRAARLRAGGLSQAMEASRDQRGISWLDELTRDLRHGARGLWRTPAFTSVALLTLALGIGANAAIFQLLDAVRDRSLAVRAPHELAIVQLADTSRWNGRRSSGYPVLTNPLWEEFRDHQRVLSGVLAWSNMDLRVDQGLGLRASRGLLVSGAFFDVLGVRPHIGRLLTSADDRPGCGTPAAVVSYGFWQRYLGGSAAAVGRAVVLNGQSVPVIGVTQRDFTGVEVGRSFDVAIPICSQAAIGGEPDWLASRTMWWLTVMGRIPTGQSIEAVNAQLAATSRPLFEASVPASYPANLAQDFLSLTLRAVPGATGVSNLRSIYADPLVILQLTTALVLFIACTNLANLVLARASAREREFAVRLAVGGSWGRLVRQLMIENALLTAGGAVAGLACAMVLSRVLVGLLGTGFVLDLPLDARLVAFMTGVAFLTCLTFGLIPAWRATRVAAVDAMKTTSRGNAGSREGTLLRRALVVAQLACSVVLVVGALLFTATLRNLLAVDPGFDPRGVAIVRVDLSLLRIDRPRRTALIADVLDRIRRTPGVTSAAEVRHVPLGNTGTTLIASPLSGDNAHRTMMRVNGVSPGYFQTMDSALIAGRDFDARDSSAAPRVAIVNRAFARWLGLGDRPIGQRFRGESSPSQTDVFEVVGLVPDSKYSLLREEPLAIIFVPMAQIVDPRPFTDIAVRSMMPTGELSTALSAAVAEVSTAIYADVGALESNIRDRLLRERLMALLSGVFGALAALIAAVGLYGVMAYLVQRRTNEIGIRMALGARQHAILAMVLGEAWRLVIVGLTIGAAMAFAAAGSARTLLFGLEPHDVRPVALACVLLGAIATAASYLPARRAATMPPVASLRVE
jgi:putative ABC transport system permease protein